MERILKKGISEDDEDDGQGETTSTIQSLKDYLSPKETINLKIYLKPKEKPTLDAYLQPKERLNVRDYLKSEKKVTLHGYLSTVPTVKGYIKEGTTVPSSTDVEEVAPIIEDAKISTQEKIKRIARVAQRDPKYTLETEDPSVKQTIYQAISSWISGNWKQIAWSIAWSTAISLAVGIAYISFTSGSWLLLLELLKRLGLRTVPKILISALTKAGFSIGSSITVNGLIGLAKKNDKLNEILQKKIPTGYLSVVAKKLGVNLKETVQAEDVLRYAINTGTNFGVVGLNGYLISTGLNVGIKRAKEVVGGLPSLVRKTEKLVEDVSTVSLEAKEKVAEVVLNPTKTPVVKEVVETIEKSAPRELRNKENSVNKVRAQTQVDQSVENSIGYNKLLTAASIASITLVSVALATTSDNVSEILKEQLSIFGDEAVSKLGSLEVINQAISSIYKFAKESRYLKLMATQYLLEKVGVNRLLDVFVDYLTPKQEAKLRSIRDLMKKEKSKSRLAKLSDQFLTILTGGKYYDLESLEKIPVSDLRKIYREVNPKDIKFSRYTKEQLQALILSEQKQRRLMITNLLNTTMKAGLKIAAATITYEAAVEGYAFAKSSIEEINAEQEKLRAQEERELSQKQAQELKTEQKLKLEEAKAEFRKEKELERSQEELRKLEYEQRHEQALKRLRERMEKKKLREVLQLEEISKRMNVVITTEDGVSHPIPPDEVLLNKDLQKALDIKVTPLFEYLTKEAAKASTSWVPGIGWIQAGIQKINLSLATAETVKDIGKIVEVLSRIDRGETDIDPMLGKLDNLLKVRLPSLTSVVEDAIKTSEISLKELVLRKLKDKVLEGWDNQRVAYEIGKELIGPGEDFGIDVVQGLGEGIWDKLW